MITMIVELSCDEQDCHNAYVPSITELTSIRATRIGSMIVGWTRSRDKDYCPEHRQPNKVDQIRTLAGQRLTDKQIGVQLGVTGARVQQIRKAHGIAPGQGRVGRPATGCNHG